MKKGNKTPLGAYPGAPPPNTPQGPGNVSAPPAGPRMSLAALKNVGKNKGPPGQKPISGGPSQPPTPLMEKSLSALKSPQVGEKPTLTISTKKLSSKPSGPSISNKSTDNTDTPSSISNPCDISSSIPSLPPFLSLTFDKFLAPTESKIQRSTRGASYPTVGLHPQDLASLGLIVGDLLILSQLIDPQADDYTSNDTPNDHIPCTPTKTPSTPSTPFRHKHPGSSSQQPPTGSSSQQPTPSLFSSSSYDSQATPKKNKNGQSSTIPEAYLQCPLLICQVRAYPSLTAGTFRLDPLCRMYVPSLAVTDILSRLSYDPSYLSRQLSSSSSSHHHISSLFSPSHTISQTQQNTRSLEWYTQKRFVLHRLPLLSSQRSYHTHQLLSLSSSPSPSLSLLSSCIRLKSIHFVPIEIVAQNIMSSSLSDDINNAKHHVVNSSNSTASQTNNSLIQSMLISTLHSSIHYIIPGSPVYITFSGNLFAYLPISISIGDNTNQHQYTIPFARAYNSNNNDGSSTTILSALDAVHSPCSPSQTPCLFISDPQIEITIGNSIIASSSPSLNKSSQSVYTPTLEQQRQQQPQLQDQQQQQPKPTSTIQIAGVDHEMRVLRDTLELPLLKPELFSSFGLKPIKGVLLFGPPGCGKTLLASWFAEQTAARFIPITPSTITSSSNAPSYLNTLFSSLSQPDPLTRLPPPPTVVFIDEIDSLCSDPATVSTLLTLLDGGHSLYSNICLLAATNRPNALPAALRRPGRLDVELNLRTPVMAARIQILSKKMERVVHTMSEREITQIAEWANGFVGADLDLLVSEAISHSVIRSYYTTHDNITHNTTTIPDNTQQHTLTPSSTMELFIQQHPISPVEFSDFLPALRLVRPSGLRDVASLSLSETRVGGHEHIKKQLEEAFDWPIKHAKLVDVLGARRNSGILLYGPPGCAKTLLAKAVCARSHRTFLTVQGPELFSKYVGDSEKAVRQVFQRARACAPCILFLDEVDSFGASRGSGGGGGDATDRVVSQLLVEMDGIGDRGDVCVLAATNRPDLVDPALLRAGRFDRSLYVGPPDQNDAREILDIQCSTMRVSPDIYTHLDELATILYNKQHTGAEITAICRDAGVRALTRFIQQQEYTNTTNTDNDDDIISSLSLDNNDIRLPTTSSDYDTTTTTSIDQSVYVTLDDLRSAITDAVPRIGPGTIQFYKDYQASRGLTTL